MNSFFKRIFFLLTLFCFFSCVLESADNFGSSAQTALQASGSSFNASEKIYLNLSDATFSLDGTTYTEILSSADSTDLVSFDSSEKTLLNVDLSETAKNMGVYISGTNDTSKIGGIRIQTYYESDTDYYEVGIYLNGATITSTDYPCLYITKGAPASVFLVEGTTNSLTDGRSYGTSYSEDQKGTLFCKDSLALSGSGSLNVKQAYKNCIASKAFLTIESGTYTIQNYLSDDTKSSSTGKNGFYGDQGITLEGGNITFNGYGIIGKEANSSLIYDLRKANAFKTDDETYASSYVKINGGTVNVSTYNGKAINAPLVEISGGTNIFTVDGLTTYVAGNTSAKVSDADGNISTDTISYKPQGIDANTLRISGGSTTISSTWSGINSNGVVNISGGSLGITTSGAGVYDSSEKDYTAPSCIKADGNIIVSGGTVTGVASGNGSKGIKAGGTYTQSNGSVNVKATGSNLGSSSSSGGFGSSSSSSSASSAAKGVRVAGAINISGGKLYSTSTNNEAIESKSTITITGGEVYGYSTGDDAINSASTMTISGGYVCGYSSANDGLDANGNMYIKGGVIFAVCTTTPEVALDANTEGGYKLYISGGTLMALGPLESGASLSQSCYQASSWSANTSYGLTVGNTTYVFKTPSTTSGYGSGIVVSGSSTPSLTSAASSSGGTSYFDGLVYVGGTKGSTSITLSSYSSSSSGGGNPGGNSGGGSFGGGGNSGPGGR